MNYIGEKPNISYYVESKHDFTNEDKILYNSIPKYNWDLKLESLNYFADKKIAATRFI